MEKKEIRNIQQPPKKSAREMFYEIQNWLNISDIELKVRCIKMKQNDYFQKQNTKIDNIFFWNRKIQKALQQDQYLEARTKTIQQFDAILLNEEIGFLAQQFDCYQFIDNVLIKPQEELFGVPKWQPSLREKVKTLDQIYSICVIYFSGNEIQIQKLKAFEEGKTQKINLFGKECQLQVPQSKQKELKLKSGFRIYGSEIMFGFMNSKFYQYWSTNQVMKYYQDGSVLLEEIILELDEVVATVYFTICIDNVQRVNCKIQFCTLKNGDQKEIQRNKTFSNGGIIVEKGKDKNQIIFFVKVFGAPKCYINYTVGKEQYKSPSELKYQRCQNFLINEMINYVSHGLIRQFSYLRFSVNYEQTQNSNFLNFCQRIEEEGYLNKYCDEQSIQLKKFTDYILNNYILENVKLCLNWMLVSAQFGRFKILSPYFNLENFMEKVQDIQAAALAKQIKNLKVKRYEKAVKEPFQSDKFTEIIIKNSQTHPEEKFEDILLADLTLSGLIPNYSISENFPIQNTEVVNRKQIKGKAQYKQNRLDQEIGKVRIRDENWELLRAYSFNTIISEKQFNLLPQNKLIYCAYFRQILKGKLNILGRNYQFFGFDCKSLRKGEFYIVNNQFFLPTMKYMFGQLTSEYLTKYKDRVVRCSQIQEILNEHFNQLHQIVFLDDIQAKLFDNHQLEPQDQSIQIRGPFFRTKIETKIPNRRKIKDNNYTYKVLMPQGKVSSDVMKIINEIAFLDTDYCAFIIRYKDMKGIITSMHNNNKQGMITLYDTMKGKHTQANELFDHIEQSIRIDNKNISDIQILGVPDYKPCLLKLFQVLNIVTLDHSHERKVLKQFKIYYSLLHKAKNMQKIQNIQKKEFYQNMSQNEKVIKELLLPIQDGAYLMGVYDQKLGPDEVFIQIQVNQEPPIIIQSKSILIFKKNYIREDGIHLFQNVEKQKQEELAKFYKNVIVFSAHMLGSKFAFDEFDDKQKFISVWDQNLISSDFQLSTIDAKESYNKLKFENKDKNASNSEVSKILNFSLQQNEIQIDPEQLESLQNQMIDYFCFFQSGTNFQELVALYTKVMLYKQLYFGDQSFMENYQTIVDTLKVMNLIYLWFAHCQARKQIIQPNIKQMLQQINLTISSIEAEAHKLFQI